MISHPQHLTNYTDENGTSSILYMAGVRAGVELTEISFPTSIRIEFQNRIKVQLLKMKNVISDLAPANFSFHGQNDILHKFYPLVWILKMGEIYLEKYCLPSALNC